MEISGRMSPAESGSNLFARTHQAPLPSEEPKEEKIKGHDATFLERAESIVERALPLKSSDALPIHQSEHHLDGKIEGLAQREIEKKDLPRNPVFSVVNEKAKEAKESETFAPKSPQLIVSTDEELVPNIGPAPDAKQTSSSGPASQRVKGEESSDALLNPEDVPRSQNIYDINRLTLKLQEFRKVELEYMIYIACIDNEMRETITLVWSGASCLLEVVNDLLQRDKSARDFASAQKKFKAKLDQAKQEELTCYKSLLGARDAIISNGQRIMITRELKIDLLGEYESLIDKRFADIAKEFTQDSLSDLEGLKEKLEDIIEEKLLLKDDLLESKVSLHMEAEDLKTTSEYKALVRARKKLTAEALASDLWEAAESGNVDKLMEELQKCSLFAKFLAIENRFINKKNGLGFTPLMIACYDGHMPCVSLLLENKASRKIRDNNGYQALHWAARGGFLEICKQLIDNGPEIIDVPAMVKNEKGEEVGVYRDRQGNEFGGYGRTALHRAAYHGHVDTLRLLLNYGANPNVRTTKENNCVTPLHEAVQQAHTEVIVELLRRKIDPYKPGVIIPELQQRVELDVETQDFNGRTALWWAISLGRTDYAAKFIAHPSYRRKKDPKDPNSLENLLLIVPPADKKDEVKKFLENLRT